MNKTLLAWLAAIVLWVTIKIVCPLLLILVKIFNNSPEDFESSAPVGSSASKISGSVIIALATAALCFSPPETS